MSRFVIAIDGPSGAGKSTVARRVAEALGCHYLDTGALYRAVALGLVRAGIKEDASDSELPDALKRISVEFRSGRVFLNGEDVEDEIRKPDIGHYSSVFSAKNAVREFLMPVQKSADSSRGLVAEGRDMGTVVFPDAEVKLFLDASIEARAERRCNQLREMGIEADIDSALDDVAQRDARDSSRDIAPLAMADDAIYIESSSMPLEGVISLVLERARERGLS